MILNESKWTEKMILSYFAFKYKCFPFLFEFLLQIKNLFCLEYGSKSRCLCKEMNAFDSKCTVKIKNHNCLATVRTEPKGRRNSLHDNWRRILTFEIEWIMSNECCKIFVNLLFVVLSGLIQKTLPFILVHIWKMSFLICSFQ